MKKTKKYFVGGAINQGINMAGQSLGLGNTASGIAGGAGQLAVGAATGNPMDMVGGAMGMIGAGATNAMNVFQNEDASFGQKALAAYGTLNPAAALVSSKLNENSMQDQADNKEFNSLIANRMKDGGNIARQTYNEFQYYPTREDLSMTAMVPQMIGDLPVQAPNIPAPDLRHRGLQENLYRNTMTNKYDGAPRSIPRGERINPAIVSGARAEDARNQQIHKYFTDAMHTNLRTQGDLQSLMTDPEMGHIQKLPYENGGDLLELGGFTHDDPSPANVFEGNLVKSGLDGNHVVEKDETMLNGKVYSNNKDMPVPKGRYKGKTFAKASKAIDDLTKERKSDPIFNKHKDNALADLFDMQEELKRTNNIQQEMQMKCGGKMYFKGGKINEGEFDVDDISQEEIQYLNSLGYNIEVEG